MADTKHQAAMEYEKAREKMLKRWWKAFNKEAAEMSPNQMALAVSNDIMRVEAFLPLICDHIERRRRDGENTAELQEAYLACIAARDMIHSAHMSLTLADNKVFGRPVPMSR